MHRPADNLYPQNTQYSTKTLKNKILPVMIKFYIISSCGLKSTLQKSEHVFLAISASQSQIQRPSGDHGKGRIFKRMPLIESHQAIGGPLGALPWHQLSVNQQQRVIADTKCNGLK